MMRKEKRKRNYTWYVQPLDAFTNQAIVNDFLQDAEEFQTRVCCEDGIYRDFYQLHYDILSRIIQSRVSLGLKFNVYVQEGRGQIRNAEFLLENSRIRRKKRELLLA